MIHTGDCVEVMRTLPDASVDAVVTDPPYFLTFMGRAWDSADSPKHQQELHEQWATEAFRVLKPGGYLLAFGGTRTVHRLASAIEDAGFEIRDELVWVYASGFPKSLNLNGDRKGWGTALKPAHEPIVMARKPLVGTVVANVQKFGTGAINIDGSRIPGAEPYVYPDGPKGNVDPTSINLPRIDGERVESHPQGRWPSNVLLSDPELFDQPNPYVVGSGATTTVPGTYTSKPRNEWATTSYAGSPPGDVVEGYGDSGGYSRFFIIPKADRAEREPVLRGQLEPGMVGGRSRADGRQWDIPGSTLDNNKPKRGNTHPTVKPVDLMRHLVRLVTPPGGTVLDPFLGSGTTAIACELEGFGWIGIEKEPEYVAIAEARLNGTQRGLGL